MKRKRSTGRRKPKKPSIVGEDEPFNTTNHSGLNDFNSGQFDSRMEARTQQNNTNKDGPRAGLEERGAVKRLEDYANSLPETVASSPCKAARGISTRSSRRMDSSITYLTNSAILLQRERTLQKEANTPHQDPRYKELELNARTQQNNTDKGGPRAGLEKRGAVKDRVEDYANSLPETVTSSPCKAARGISTRSSKRMGSSITNLTNSAILLQRERTLQEEANNPHQDPRYKVLELNAALAVIKKVMQMNAAGPFNVPVDPIALGIPDYFDVIDTPMDFGTICSNLENRIKYLNSKDVFEDVQYIWENCSKYNMKGHYVLELMEQVKKNFAKYWTEAGLYSEPPGEIDGPLHLPAMESTMRGSKHGPNNPVSSMTDNPGHLQQHQLGLSPLELHQPSLSYNQICQPQQKPCQCQSSCVHPQPSQLEADIDISNAGNSNPNSSQPSSPVSPAYESLEGKAPNGKMKVIIEDDGSVVGEYSKVWSTRTGDFVRAHIPISYKDIRKVPKNFKDDVWNALMGEFELYVPPAVARPLAEKSWSQKFRTYKNTLRALLKNGDPTEVKPKDIDPDIWRKFVENEIDPIKKQQSITNFNNRKKLEFSHCLGRRSYAQKQYLMQQENPGKQVRRVDKWLAAHERSDGTVLESAKSKYDEVKAAENRRKGKNLNDAGCSETCEDLDSDELAEVFGKEKKGGVRGVGSHISKKQLIHIGVARSKIEEKKKANEEAPSLKDKIISHVESKLDNFEGIMLSLISKLSNMTTPPLGTMPSSDFVSYSVNRPTHLTQNLNNVFGTMGVSHYPHSGPTPTNKPQVILLDKFGKELAKGYVVMDATAKVCHLKQVGMGEKKVYIEEVIEPDARLWDPPQWGHDTLSGFVQGGYLIWLECWLRYV